MNTKIFYGFSNQEITTEDGTIIPSGTEICIVCNKDGSKHIELLSGLELIIALSIDPELVIDDVEWEEILE